MWNCKKCGTSNSDNSNYCSNCGQKKKLVDEKMENDSEANSKKIYRNILVGAVVVITLLIVIIVFLMKDRREAKNGSNDYSQAGLIVVDATEIPLPSGTPTPDPTAVPTPTPTPIPTPTPKVPGIDDIRGCNEGIVYPNGTWLSDYETKYVKTKHGVRAYLRYAPTEDSGYYSYVYERDKVTVLARQNGYSLVKTTDGMAGWVTSSVLVDTY